MRLLLRYAFGERRLHKLNNSLLAGNTASARMFEKLGAVVEGSGREVPRRDPRRPDPGGIRGQRSPTAGRRF